jgi:hypothetical protein
MESVFFKRINKDKINAIAASGQFPFSQNLFWDTPIEKIDLQQHKKSIIERVITRGLLEDFYLLLQIYSKEEITAAILSSKILDKKTANFCSLVFNIPKHSIYVSPYYS